MNTLLFNAYFLFQPYAGMGVYTGELLKVIASECAHRSILLYPDFIEDNHHCIETYTKLGYAFEKMSTPQWLPKLVRILYWEYIKIPLRILKESFPVQYFSFYPHPLCTMSFPHQYAMVIHDAIPWKNPSYHEKWTRKIYNWLIARTARKEQIQLFSVSETSALDIKEVFSPKKEVCIVKNGVDTLAEVPLLLEKTMREKWNIQGPYILYFGGYDKRKNAALVVKLFTKFAKDFPNYTLVLAGNAHFQSPLYDNPIDLAKQHERIIATGFISKEDLRALFHYAEGFVMLSEQEGYNINIASALYEQCPTLMSDIPPHRELWSTWATAVSLNDEEQLDIAYKQFMRTSGDIRYKKSMTIEEKNQRTWLHEGKKLLEYFH